MVSIEITGNPLTREFKQELSWTLIILLFKKSLGLFTTYYTTLFIRWQMNFFPNSYIKLDKLVGEREVLFTYNCLLIPQAYFQEIPNKNLWATMSSLLEDSLSLCFINTCRCQVSSWIYIYREREQRSGLNWRYECVIHWEMISEARS